MTENKDGWIEHDGKGMPVDGETLVALMFRDGMQTFVNMTAKEWQPDGWLFGLTCGVKESFQYQQPLRGYSAPLPSSGHKAKPWIGAPDCFRIDEGVVPLTRPAAISDAVSLSDKLGRQVFAFVPEERAFNTFLPVSSIGSCSPNKDSITGIGSQHNVLSRPDELRLFPVLVSAGIVSLIKFQAGEVAVLRDVPERLHLRSQFHTIIRNQDSTCYGKIHTLFRKADGCSPRDFWVFDTDNAAHDVTAYRIVNGE